MLHDFLVKGKYVSISKVSVLCSMTKTIKEPFKKYVRSNNSNIWPPPPCGHFYKSDVTETIYVYAFGQNPLPLTYVHTLSMPPMYVVKESKRM